VEEVDGFFRSILSEVIKFKNVRNTTNNICRCKNGHLKEKSTLASSGILGFKSLVLQKLRKSDLLSL
jgi:hypothetical protein